MNETPDQNSDKTNSPEDRIFLPNISSDSNANQNEANNLKPTETLPKTKLSLQNSLNGIGELKIKVNNNLPGSPIKNGTSNLYKDSFLQNNVDSSSFEKPCPISNFEITTTNGFKYSSVKNLSCSNSQEILETTSDMRHSYTNGVNQYEQEEIKHNSILSEAEAGPSSTSNDRSENPSISSNHSTRDLESDDCSSDTGNDELSCCDDCCIYTYKGDIADLPRSFMNLEHQDNIDGQDGSRAGSRGSSPEMDFLEMDFDPGPSCDAESDESSANIELKEPDISLTSNNFNHNKLEACCSVNIKKKDYNQEPKPSCSKSDFQNYSNHNEPQPSCSKSDFQNYSNQREPEPCCSKVLVSLRVEENCSVQEDLQNNLSQQNMPSTSKMIKILEQNVKTHSNKPIIMIINNKPIMENLLDVPWVPKNPSKRTVACNISQDSKGHHSSSGDLISWTSENILPSTSSTECRINTSSSLYHSTMEKKLVLDKQHSNVENPSFIEKTMIWTEQEAALKQITQISTSACGATAVINVLQALGHEVPSNEKVMESVGTRLRSNSSPLIKYLKSRSIAGSTHKDLIIGLHKLTDGKVYARFFHMFPERYLNLSLWLSYWIKKGAVPIATLNLQKGVNCGGSIPDAWHHQMLFGVGPHGIYMTNPLERVEEGLLWHQLTSESVLLVRREDVISRFDYKKSLKEMMAIKDVRWRKLNVVGQTANVIREHRLKCSTLSRTHVCIPASYEAGITLAINVSNPAFELLKTCPELPILGTLP